MRKISFFRLSLLSFLIGLGSGVAHAQTTAFTYQGKLTDGGTSPTGTYEMQFKIFDVAGTQQPQPTPVTLTFTVAGNNAVSVVNGAFTVSLDFGAGVFPGANRFLEISVRHSSSESFVTLAPRQPVTSTPYAVRSKDATAADALSNICVLCVTDAQIQSIAGSKVTGAVANATNATNATTATNVSGIVPIANGGTGSSTQNFVDLTNNQTNIDGNKTFTGNVVLNSNLGIGTNPSAFRFDVVGRSRFRQNLGFTGATNSAGFWLFQNSPVDDRAFIGMESDNGVGLYGNNGGGWGLVMNTQTGNVGIGTDAPSDTLDVAGNIKFSGNIRGRGVLTWQTADDVKQQAQPNNGYITTNDAEVTVTLPASPVIGDIIRVSGMGVGGWKVVGNAGQFIAPSITTTGENWIPHENNRGWTAVASSAEGTKLVAAASGSGSIYTSADSGATWTQRSPTGNWSAVASSADGTRLIAVSSGGSGAIYVSGDSGNTWTARGPGLSWHGVASSADGQKLVAVPYVERIYTSNDFGQTSTPHANTSKGWASVASSADGAKLIAAAYDDGSLNSVPDEIYLSNDSGATWTPVNSIGGGHWDAVASSANGSSLAAVKYGAPIFISNDSGLTWTPRESSRTWQSIVFSADGTKVVAVVNEGQIYTSYDSGVTWRPRESIRFWSAVASSSDGTKLIAAVTGGQIYTTTILSVPNGRASYVAGGQFSSVELQYIGNGLFLPISHEGSVSAFY